MKSAKSVENSYDLFISGIELYRNNFNILKDNKKKEIESFLVKMLDSTPEQLNRKISKEISSLDYIPLKIVRYLALKTISVAKPILMHSRVLTERDLLVIINIRGNQHRAAIATRKDVTFPISHKLVEKGNDNVIRTLIANLYAPISQDTFKLIGDKITMKGKLEEIITSRNDISANALKYLLGKFNNQEHLTLLKKSNNKLKSIITNKMEDLSADENCAPDDHSNNDEKLKKLYELRNTYSSQDATEQTLINAIKSDEHDTAICLFSILSELELEETLEVISNADARKLAIVSKAKNLKIGTLKTILNSKIWDPTLSRETVSDAIRTFKSLNQSIARGLLNKHQAAA